MAKSKLFHVSARPREKLLQLVSLERNGFLAEKLATEKPRKLQAGQKQTMRKHLLQQTLLSASDTAMECLKVVDIRVLQNVLVCKIGFNVVSPWQASMNGWDTFLTQGSDSCLSKATLKGTIWVPANFLESLGGLGR